MTGAPGLTSFSVTSRIRFHHCDPAGIAFFARVDELLNAAFEDWCAAAGMPFTEMMTRDRLGFPLAHVTLDYLVPMRMGDEVVITLAVTSVGRSSITFAVAIARAGAVCARGTHVRVLTSLETQSSVALPDRLRDQLTGGAAA